MDRQKIATSFAALRLNAGLSCVAIAHILGITTAEWRRYERGVSIPTEATIDAIGAILHVDTDKIKNGSISTNFSNDLPVFAKNIISIRANLGMSQEQLADKIACKRATVAQWERGGASPRNGSLARLSAMVAIPEAEILLSPIETKLPLISPQTSLLDERVKLLELLLTERDKVIHLQSELIKAYRKKYDKPSLKSKSIL
jgi:transcriptional regulator with XRE-family HTH domain